MRIVTVYYFDFICWLFVIYVVRICEKKKKKKKKKKTAVVFKVEHLSRSYIC